MIPSSVSVTGGVQPPAHPAGMPAGHEKQGFDLDRSARAGRVENSAAGVEALYGPWKRLDAVKQKITVLLGAEGARTQPQEIPYFLREQALGPEASDGSDLLPRMRETNLQLLQLQMEAQSCTFEIELLSKVAEQSTSSTKQVLQTQA